MLADILFAGLEQIRNVLLRQPDRLVFEPDFDFHPSVFGGIDEELALAGRIRVVGSAHAVTSLSIFMMSSSRRLMSVSMTSSGRGGS